MIMKLIAGIPLELSYHNIISNNKCDGLKNRKIGQSAAKILNKIIIGIIVGQRIATFS